MTVGGILFATEAGGCAALASVCAKIATSSKASSVLIDALFDHLNDLTNLDLQIYTELGVLVFRLLAVTGIFLFNAVMWVLFTKSMHLCSSTLEATAFNTSSNFIFTAVAGKLLFGEHLSIQWFLGSTLMVWGLLVLHTGSSSKSDEHGNDVLEDRNSFDVKLKKS